MLRTFLKKKVLNQHLTYSTFTLNVDDIGFDRSTLSFANYGGNAKGYLNALGSDVTWYNVDFQKILGPLYDEFETFELVPTFFICGKNGFSTSGQLNNMAVMVSMQGLLFMPTGLYMTNGLKSMPLFMLRGTAYGSENNNSAVVEWSNYRPDDPAQMQMQLIPNTNHSMVFLKPDGPVNIRIFFNSVSLNPDAVVQSASTQKYSNWMISFRINGYKKQTNKRKFDSIQSCLCNNLS